MKRTILLISTLVFFAACSGGAPQGTSQGSNALGPGGNVDAPSLPADDAIGVQPIEGTPLAGFPANPPGSPAPMKAQPLTFAREWIVSPRGNDAGPGSRAQPFRTITKAVEMAGPGDGIRVEAGTYAEKVVIDGAVRAGTPNAKITLLGEGSPKIVGINEGSSMVVRVARANWVIDGFDIDVKGLKQIAVGFAGGSNGSVISNCDVHHGTAGSGINAHDGANGILILNNHIHHFSRSGGADDSHGVVVTPTAKNITIQKNDIHDNSGDSVQCLGPEGFSNDPPADGVLIENNRMYANRENGVDVKTCFNVKIRNNIVFNMKPSSSSRGEGLLVHMSAKNVTLEDNQVYNTGLGIAVGGNRQGPLPSGVVIARNRIWGISKAAGAEGSGIRIENANAPRVFNNTLWNIGGFAFVLGHGTGGNTENARVQNNVVSSPRIVSLGDYAPGLQLANNLYPATAQFGHGNTGSEALMGFADWKTKFGLDKTSFEAPVTLSSNGDAGNLALDRGVDVGGKFCGSAPDVGFLEHGC